MQTLEGVEIGGRYRLESVVGRGGMATVWRACDRRLDRPVAVKLLSDAFAEDPDFVQRFEREALIAARLSHPNLVPVHDLGFDEDRPFLVMEYIEGETLARRLDRDPGSVDARRIACGLLEALGEIHSIGVVHRDVKPGNVLLGASDRPRLTDFGIARILEATAITRTGQVIGTLRYMAPEVRSGELPNPRSDLYSLGVLLADCGPLDGELGPLVARMRAADPDRRPPSAGEALASLRGSAPASRRAPDTLLSPEPTTAEQGPADPEPTARSTVLVGRRLRRGLLPALAALAATLVVAVGLIAGAGSGPEDGAGEAGRSAQSGAGGGAEEAEAPAAPEPEPGAGLAEAAGLPDLEPDPARGRQLNDRGFQLLNEGRADDALPVLRRAVASFPEESDEIHYAYALFNLARALRLTGNPEAAVPVLERRLAFDDQRTTVRAELRRARAEAN